MSGLGTPNSKCPLSVHVSQILGNINSCRSVAPTHEQRSPSLCFQLCPSASDSPVEQDFHLLTLWTGHLKLLRELSSEITATRHCLLTSFHFSHLPTKPQLLKSSMKTGNKFPLLLFYLQSKMVATPVCPQSIHSSTSRRSVRIHPDSSVLTRMHWHQRSSGNPPTSVSSSCELFSELAGSRRVPERSPLLRTGASPLGTDAAKPADLSHASRLRDISPSHFPKYLAQ